MRDNIVEGLAKVTSESLEIVNKVNKKLVIIIMLQVIVFGMTILGITLVYFLSDYQYPSVTQESKQNGDAQSVTQEIK